MMKPREQSEAGFTLIELLVVISIIALLASILLSALQAARNKALESTTEENFHSIDTALEEYYNDHGYYPYWTSANDVSTAEGNWSLLATALAPYLPDLPTPNFPSRLQDGLIWNGYAYYHGPPHVGLTVRDDDDYGVFASCIFVYDGYYLTALLPSGQTSFTESDGGPDPAAVDPLESLGKVVVTHKSSDCPSSSITTFTY